MKFVRSGHLLRRYSLPLFIGVLIISAPQADAASFGSGKSVGFKVVQLGGIKAAAWYPTVSRPALFDYGGQFSGRVASNGAIAPGPFPVVLFSHGVGGCGTQSIFFTESLARQGYIVIAPDHRGARCQSDGSAPQLELQKLPKLLDPKSWSDSSYKDRRDDLSAILDALAADPFFSGAADVSRVGLVGHSIGGYTALGMAGAWPSWRDERVKAALLFSPYTMPFTAHRTLGEVSIPVMYQGADFDIGITPFLEGETGAYAETPSPKYFLKLRGGNHFVWTNLQCLGLKTVDGCVTVRRDAERVNDYGIRFLDRYLKGIDHAILTKKNTALSDYRFEPGGRTP